MNEFTSQPADEVPPGEQPAGQVRDEPPASQSGGGQYGYRTRYDEPQHEVLERPGSGRMIAGVAAGVAQYLGVDVALIRIAMVILTFVGGIGIPAYAAGWLLIPDEDSDSSIASELISSLQSRPS
jgi:phage shock protein C